MREQDLGGPVLLEVLSVAMCGQGFHVLSILNPYSCPVKSHTEFWASEHPHVKHSQLCSRMEDELARSKKDLSS